MDLFGVRTLPFLTRRNYYYELRHMILWSALAGLVEGQFASVVIAQSFQGGKILITIATATPAASYLFSLVWGMLCVGRPKIRLLTLFTGLTALVAGTLGAIPATPAGAVWFLVQMAAAQVLLAGVVTVRSAVWRANYPHEVRGRIAGRLQVVRFVGSILTVLIAARVCDADPTAYRYVFPVSAVLGLISVWFVRQIHLRGEVRALRWGRNSEGDEEKLGAGGILEPYRLTALLSPGHVLGRMFAVLRKDRRFARYCMAQSYTGVANLMTIPVVVTIVARRLDYGDAWGFWISAALIESIPQLLRLASITRWAKLFDRVGVLQFRVINVWWWTGSLALGLLATLAVVSETYIGAIYLPLGVMLFAARGIVSGIGLGGGAVAWNIGHLHFARSDEAEIYMGTHVFLTGIRGIMAPALGMWLWYYFGWGVWVVAVAISLLSLRTFHVLAREESQGR